MPDHRSAEAATYRGWYKRKQWLAIAAHQMQIEPLCRFCKARNIVTAATVCDHINPDKSTWEKFHAGPFQSLCKPCHDRHKQSQERLGFSTEVGLDGWPVDGMHPANR